MLDYKDTKKPEEVIVALRADKLEELANIVIDAKKEIAKANLFWVSMILVVAFYIGWSLAEAFLA